MSLFDRVRANRPSPVLVIEDDPGVRVFLVSVLEHAVAAAV